MKKNLFLLLILLWPWLVMAQLNPYQHNFFSTNANPLVEVVAGTNGIQVLYSTAGANLRRYTVSYTNPISTTAASNLWYPVNNDNVWIHTNTPVELTFSVTNVPFAGLATNAINSTNNYGNSATATLATNSINSTNFWGILSSSNLPPNLTNSIYGSNVVGAVNQATHATNSDYSVTATNAVNATNFFGLLSVTNLPYTPQPASAALSNGYSTNFVGVISTTNMPYVPQPASAALSNGYSTNFVGVLDATNLPASFTAPYAAIAGIATNQTWTNITFYGTTVVVGPLFVTNGTTTFGTVVVTTMAGNGSGLTNIPTYGVNGLTNALDWLTNNAGVTYNLSNSTNLPLYGVNGLTNALDWLTNNAGGTTYNLGSSTNLPVAGIAATGIASDKYLRGNGTWDDPAGVGGISATDATNIVHTVASNGTLAQLVISGTGTNIFGASEFTNGVLATSSITVSNQPASTNIEIAKLERGSLVANGISAGTLANWVKRPVEHELVGIPQFGEMTVLYETGAKLIPTADPVFKIWGSDQVADGIRYAESTNAVHWVTNTGLTSPNLHYRSWVLKEGSTYYCFGVPGTQGTNYNLFSSSTGTNFTSVKSNILGEGTWWDNGTHGNVCVLKQGALFYMLYEAMGLTNGLWNIGLQTSPDLTNWTAYPNNPVLQYPGSTGGPGINSDGAGGAYMWIHAAAGGMIPTDIYLLHSSDFTNWTMLNNGYPVLWRHLNKQGPGNNDNVDGGQVADPTAIEVNGQTYVFYGSTPAQYNVTAFGIGMQSYVSVFPVAMTNVEAFCTNSATWLFGPLSVAGNIEDGSPALSVNSGGATQVKGTFKVVDKTIGQSFSVTTNSVVAFFPFTATTASIHGITSTSNYTDTVTVGQSYGQSKYQRSNGVLVQSGLSVGTTNTDATLQVATSSALPMELDSTYSQQKLLLQSKYTGTTWWMTNLGVALGLINGVGSVRGYGYLNAADMGAEVPILLSSAGGNVGIGSTIIPAEKLEVSGNVVVRGNVSSTNGFTGNGSGLTNASGAGFLGTNGGTITGALLSTASTATNGPAANELVTAQFVREAVSSGFYLWNSSNVVQGYFNGNSINLYTNGIPDTFYRAHTIYSNNQYVGSVAITNLASQSIIRGPYTIYMYLGFASGASRAISVKPEIYYSYTYGTNALGDWDCGAQTITPGTTNLYTFTVDGPAVTLTNTAYLIRGLKVVSQSGTWGATPFIVAGGTDFPGHISYTVSGASAGGAQLAANNAFTGSNYFGAGLAATYLVGNGGGLTNIPAYGVNGLTNALSWLTNNAGTTYNLVNSTNLPVGGINASGIASDKYLRGNGTWDTPSGPGGISASDATNIVHTVNSNGTLTLLVVAGAGTNILGATEFTNTVTGNGSGWTNIPVSALTNAGTAAYSNATAFVKTVGQSIIVSETNFVNRVEATNSSSLELVGGGAMLTLTSGGIYGGPGAFIGDGNGLTNLNADNLASGNVPAARMPANLPVPTNAPSDGFSLTATSSSTTHWTNIFSAYIGADTVVSNGLSTRLLDTNTALISADTVVSNGLSTRLLDTNTALISADTVVSNGLSTRLLNTNSALVGAIEQRMVTNNVLWLVSTNNGNTLTNIAAANIASGTFGTNFAFSASNYFGGPVVFKNTPKLATNVWAANTSFPLQTNRLVFSSASANTGGITGILQGPVTDSAYGELLIVATGGDYTFTNAAAIHASDFVTSRIITNGNWAMLSLDVVPGVVTNMAIVQFK